jgi:microcystin degradation protein MlrC
MGIFWDPVTVRMCSEAGVGAVMNLRIGGKICPQSGDPVDVRGTVRAIKENHM